MYMIHVFAISHENRLHLWDGHREWLGDLPSDIAQLVDFDVP